MTTFVQHPVFGLIFALLVFVLFRIFFKKNYKEYQKVEDARHAETLKEQKRLAALVEEQSKILSDIRNKELDKQS